MEGQVVGIHGRRCQGAGPLVVPGERGEDAIRVAAPIRAGRLAVAHRAGIGEVGDPGLALRGAGGGPRLEPGFPHRLRGLAHLLGAAAAVLDHALEEVGSLPLPVDAGKGLGQRRQHGGLDAVGARGGEALDDHRLEALDHHAAAHLGGRGHAELRRSDLRREAQSVEQRLERRRVRPAKQQRHADAMGRHGGHHRALDEASSRAVDQRGRLHLRAGRGRIEIEEPGARPDGRRPGFGDGHRLARRDGARSRDPRPPPAPRARPRAARRAAPRAPTSGPSCAVPSLMSYAPIRATPRARRSSARMRPTSP